MTLKNAVIFSESSQNLPNLHGLGRIIRLVAQLYPELWTSPEIYIYCDEGNLVVFFFIFAEIVADVKTEVKIFVGNGYSFSGLGIMVTWLRDKSETYTV